MRKTANKSIDTDQVRPRAARALCLVAGHFYVKTQNLTCPSNGRLRRASPQLGSAHVYVVLHRDVMLSRGRNASA